MKLVSGPLIAQANTGSFDCVVARLAGDNFAQDDRPIYSPRLFRFLNVFLNVVFPQEVAWSFRVRLCYTRRRLLLALWDAAFRG